ncbi:MAG: TMEM175 family protein [Acidobacteriota bacterium]
MQHPETTRLEAFSDGIFAIAITLLILEFRAPEAHNARDLTRALTAQWPSYGGYVLSFLIIGIMWANHSHIFRLIKRADHTVGMINLVLMMTIAFLPYPTSVLARHIGNAATRGPATLFYSASILITAIPWSWLWMHALRAGLIDAPDEERDRVTASFRFGWIPWLITTVIALFWPEVSMAGIALLTLYWMVFPGRYRRPR